MKTGLLTYFFYFAILSFISPGCKNEPTSTSSYSDPIVIEVSPSSNTIRLSDVFSDYEIYEIEGCDFGKINFMAEGEGFLLLYAKTEDSQVLLYDKPSSRTIPIGKIGRGPEEYLSIKDFAVLDSTLFLLDYQNQHIKSYNMKGEYLGATRLSSPYQGFEFIDDTILILFKDVPQSNNVDTEFKISVLDKKNNKYLSKSLAIDPNLSWERATSRGFELYKLGDTAHAFLNFCDTIYYILPNSLVPKYVLNFGEKSFPQSVFQDASIMMNEFISKCMESDYIWNVNFFGENERLVFFTYIYKNQVHYNFYLKDKKESNSNSIILDDLFTNITFNNTEEPYALRPLGMGKEGYYFSIEPFILKNHLDRMKSNLSVTQWEDFCESNKNLVDLVSEIDINSNSLIILYKNTPHS